MCRIPLVVSCLVSPCGLCLVLCIQSQNDAPIRYSTPNNAWDVLGSYEGGSVLEIDVAVTNYHMVICIFVISFRLTFFAEMCLRCVYFTSEIHTCSAPIGSVLAVVLHLLAVVLLVKTRTASQNAKGSSISSSSRRVEVCLG